MRKTWMIVILLCGLFVVGCTDYRKEATLVAQDHRKITVETADALIASIQQELANPDLPEKDRLSFQDLIDRLDYMKRSSITLEKVFLSDLNNETYAELLKLIYERHNSQ